MDLKDASQKIISEIKKHQNVDCFPSPVESFKEMHAGVVKAVGEHDSEKIFFCKHPLLVDGRRGYSSIWLASADNSLSKWGRKIRQDLKLVEALD